MMHSNGVRGFVHGDISVSSRVSRFGFKALARAINISLLAVRLIERKDEPLLSAI